MAVDVDPGVAHRAVEEQRAAAPFAQFGRREAEPVPPRADKGQAARAAGMLHRLSLAVLGDGRELEVVADAEGAVDGPVVGYGDRLPRGVVEVVAGKFGRIFAREEPALFEQPFGARLREGGERKQRQHQKQFFHGGEILVSGEVLVEAWVLFQTVVRTLSRSQSHSGSRRQKKTITA